MRSQAAAVSQSHWRHQDNSSPVGLQSAAGRVEGGPPSSGTAPPSERAAQPAEKQALCADHYLSVNTWYHLGQAVGVHNKKEKQEIYDTKAGDRYTPINMKYMYMYVSCIPSVVISYTTIIDSESHSTNANCAISGKSTHSLSTIGLIFSCTGSKLTLTIAHPPTLLSLVIWEQDYFI